MANGAFGGGLEKKNKGLLALALHVRRPERQIVAQQLHDQCRVLVRVLRQSVELGYRRTVSTLGYERGQSQRTNGVVKGLLGQVARAVRRAHDLVEEHGEVERQAQADRVGGRQLLLGDGRRGLVAGLGGGGSVLARITGEELGEVAVVVADPAATAREQSDGGAVCDACATHIL